MALAIMLKDHNTNYVERRFSILNQTVGKRVHDIFNIAMSRMVPDFAQYPQFTPSFHITGIVVDAKERGTSLLYNMCNPVDNIPVYDVGFVLHEEHYNVLTLLFTSFGRSYYCVECDITFSNKNQHRCTSDYTCSMCKKIIACTSLIYKIL